MRNIVFIIIPLIIIGISVILLINNIKKNYKSEEKIDENYMTIGMSLGMCFGGGIGLFFINLLGIVAISYSICFGMLGGMLIGMVLKKK